MKTVTIPLQEFSISTGWKRVTERNQDFTLPAWQFFGAIAAAAIIIIGAFYALYTSLETRLNSISEEVRAVSTENAHLNGRLDILMPVVQRQFFEQATLNPAAFDIEPWSRTKPFLPVEGVQFFDTNYIAEIADSQKVEIVGDLEGLNSEIAALNCMAGNASDGFSCEVIEPGTSDINIDEFLIQWQATE